MSAFRGRVEKAAQRRVAKNSAEEPAKPTEGKQGPQAPESAPKVLEPAPKIRPSLERVKRTAKGTIALEGARKTARELDRVDWSMVRLAVGIGAVIVCVGVTAVVVSGGRKR